MDFENKNQILSKLKNDLFPVVQPSKLILKIASLHLASTALVMTFCPQFGLGLFKNGHYGLTSLFMMVSHEFCQFMCGLTLFSVSLLAIYNSLKITELEWIMSQKTILAGLAIALTGSFFWMLAPHINLLFLSLWAAGALLPLSLSISFLRKQNNYSSL